MLWQGPWRRQIETTRHCQLRIWALNFVGPGKYYFMYLYFSIVPSFAEQIHIHCSFLVLTDRSPGREVARQANRTHKARPSSDGKTLPTKSKHGRPQSQSKTTATEPIPTHNTPKMASLHLPVERSLSGDDRISLNPILPNHSRSGTRINRSYTRTHRTLPRVTTGIQPAGESGRKWINPLQFLRICYHSTSRASRICNIFWPVVPAAMAVTYVRTDLHLAIFVLNYLAMIPCANLIGFAGQELATKLHRVLGVLVETTLGSVVEIVMFMVLIKNDQFQVIQAAILGSVLATQLLCLGMCFLIGGIRHNELEFSEEVSEVGSDLLLTA
jgi:Sodium/calcium exchanger protein